jgi:hypothetical protein
MNRGLTVIIPIPALLTSMSISPKRAYTSSRHASTERSSRTSSSTPRVPAPIASAAAAARGRSRLVITTRAPATANACAIACPRPLVPPVTTTRAPARSSHGRLHLNLAGIDNEATSSRARNGGRSPFVIASI